MKILMCCTIHFVHWMRRLEIFLCFLPMVCHAQKDTDQYSLDASSFYTSNAVSSLYSYESLSHILPPKVNVQMKFSNPPNGRAFDQETYKFGILLASSKDQYERFKRLNEALDVVWETAEEAPSSAAEASSAAETSRMGDPRVLFAKAGIRLFMKQVKEQTERDISASEDVAARGFWAGRQVQADLLQKALENMESER